MGEPPKPLTPDQLHARVGRCQVGAGHDRQSARRAPANLTPWSRVRRDGRNDPRAREELDQMEDRGLPALRPRITQRIVVGDDGAKEAEDDHRAISRMAPLARVGEAHRVMGVWISRAAGSGALYSVRPICLVGF